MKKKLLAWIMSGVMLFSGIPMSAVTALAASATSEGSTGTSQTIGTVYGKEETVSLETGSTGRNRDFDEDWKFNFGSSSTAQNTNFDDSSWSDVTLPHDFSISRDFTTSGEAESGFHTGGTGWYRRHFTMPSSDEGKTVILNFDGAYNNTTVYVNGNKVGENHYGYNSFAFDVSKYLTYDGTTENVVAVQVVSSFPSSRWYCGGGINRDVELIVTDPVHIEENGISVTTPDISNENGTTNASVEVKNDSAEEKQVTVSGTIYDADGKAVSSTASTTITAVAGSVTDANLSANVSSPALWSPEHPNLYTMKVALSVENAQTDSLETKFGYRYTSFDTEKGFFLNGSAVKLNGVCLHQDQGALGSAQEYDAMYRQIMKMKDMGVNCIRTSHGIADPKFIEICDEVGMMVMEEAFDGWSGAKNGNSQDFSQYFAKEIGSDGPLESTSSMTWVEYTLKSMIRRDKNSPAVILWDLGNEVSEGVTSSPNYESILNNLITWMKAEDATRSFTIGNNKKVTSGTQYILSSTIKSNGGVAGYNYANENQLSSLHSLLGPIIATETSSATNSRGFYTSRNSNSSVDSSHTNELTSYDTSTVSWGMTAHDSMWQTLRNDYVAGEFVWTGFDYIGEPTPWNGTGTGSVSGGSGATPNSSYFGIVDTAGFEKDTYYLYRAQWNESDTTLHLVTAWDPNNQYVTNGKTPVIVYSNAPVVKLYLNGEEIGTATRTENTTAAGHKYYTYTTQTADGKTDVCTAVAGSGSASLYAEFDVAYTKGTISAKAFEADGTTEITPAAGKASVTTPGTVSQVKAVSEQKSVTADGRSFAYVELEAEDADGNLVSTADNELSLALTGNGTIAGVDNGDPATTQKYQVSSALTSGTQAKIHFFRGRALVIIRSTKETGTITLTASADNVTSGTVSVTSTASSEEEQEKNALTSYTLVRDYSVKVGTKPELKNSVTGTKGDGTTVTGTVTWDEISESEYQTAGDYLIKGTVSLSGFDAIPVTARLHVIPNVIAMRNVSTVTAVNTVPSLPDTVKGVLSDGTLTGDFAVKWDAVTADQFSNAEDKVTVNGAATVLGTETLPVTCSVRVAQPVTTESTNVASAASLSQDILSENQSDNLNTLTDGKTAYDNDTNYRWTNYKNRNNSSTAAVTLTWSTAQLISSLNLFFFTDSQTAALPQSVKIEYSANGTEFTEISYQNVTPTAGFTKTEYVLEKTINPVAIRITLTEQSGKCVGLTEVEAMTAAQAVTAGISADLSSISVDDITLSAFSAETTEYTAEGEAVTAALAEDSNAGVTILPAVADIANEKNKIVKILTVSEDGSKTRTYTVTLTEKKAETQKTTPKVTLTAAKGSGGKIKLTGKFEDYTNQDKYYEVTEHGFIYKYTPNFYGHHILMVTTPGRTKVRCKNYRSDGSGTFVYSMTPKNRNTKYEIRAYLAYKDADGQTKYVYSDSVWAALKDLQ